MNDIVDAPVLQQLARVGIRLVVLRSAGFNNVDLAAARRLGIKIARVPGYSPEAVAEHTVAMMLALNRNIPSTTDSPCLDYRMPRSAGC